jgi:EmrB/QacA subfamily drug resistance transporter
VQDVLFCSRDIVLCSIKSMLMLDKKRIILTIACLAIFFEALDLSVLNMAIPQMERYFHFSVNAIQWVQTVYVLCFGGFVLLGGRLADTIGRKKIFLTGAVVFLMASLCAGFSTGFSWLLVFRACQGTGAALAIPAAIAVITHTFTDPVEKNKALGIFGAMAGVGFATGLAFGGLISSYAGWQWIFFINVPIIGTMILLAMKYIPADEVRSNAGSSNIISGIMITVLMMLAAYLLHALGHIADDYPVFLLLLACFLVLGFVFLKRERRHPAPLLDFKIFRVDGVITGNWGGFLLGCVYLSYIFLLSLVLQQEMHYSALKSGLILFPFSILSAIISKYVLPHLFARYGVIKTGIIGNVCMLMGVVFFLWSAYNAFAMWGILAAVLSINSFGMAISFPCMTILSVQSVPETQQGLAAGITATANSFGGGLGLSVVTLVMQLAVEWSFNVYRAGLWMLVVFALPGILQLYVYYRRPVVIGQESR